MINKAIMIAESYLGLELSEEQMFEILEENNHIVIEAEKRGIDDTEVKTQLANAVASWIIGNEYRWPQ